MYQKVFRYISLPHDDVRLILGGLNLFAYLLQGIFLGLGIAVPVGPTSVELLRRGLYHGFASAFFLGFGAICIDSLYFSIGLMGFGPWLWRLVWLRYLLFPVVAYILIRLAYTAFTSLPLMEELQQTPKRGSSFWYGFGVTAFNPATLVFWFSLASGLVAHQFAHKFLLLLGQFSGGMLWFIALAFSAAKFRQRLSIDTLRIATKISGLVMILFLLYFGWQLFF